VNYGILDGRTVLRSIGNGLLFPVPERTTLIFLKLKATSDREYRIENDISHDIEWERSKLKKDRADILALLDPGGGGQEVDIVFLGTVVERYPFLAECLKKVALDAEAVGFYRRMGQDSAEVLIKQVMSLIG
jgi:hypothetical protein